MHGVKSMAEFASLVIIFLAVTVISVVSLLFMTGALTA